VLALVAAAAWAEDEVLVAGEPALTGEMAGRVQRFFEWGLGLQLTDRERDELRLSLVETWQGGEKAAIQGVVDLLQFDKQVSELTDAERAAQREAVEAALLEQFRASPEEEGSKWFLGAYERAHKAIAEGTPPLTRQAADAYLEMLTFMLGEAAGQSGVAADQATRESFAAGLAEQYKGLPAEQQGQIAGAPMAWAGLRVGWQKATDEEKVAVRKQWAEDLKAYLPAAQPEGQTAEQKGLELLKGAVEDLKAQRVTEAVQKIELAIQTAPKLAFGYFIRGELLRVAEENEAALADLSRAVELDAGLADAYDSRALVYDALKRADEAKADRGKAEALRKVAEKPADGESGATDWASRAAQLQAQQQSFQMMSNIMRMQHETNMVIIGNMGGNTRYEYRYY
jgi:tetratricopeptide (TPR) repeat protein